MKALTLIIITFFTLNAFAAENEKLVELTGKTPSGESCTYSVYKMNNWEGQIIVFLTGQNGNFRVELKSESYDEGRFESQYSDGIEFSYEGGDLTSVQLATEPDDTDKEVRISLKSNDLLNPNMAQATHLPEHVSCMF